MFIAISCLLNWALNRVGHCVTQGGEASFAEECFTETVLYTALVITSTTVDLFKYKLAFSLNYDPKEWQLPPPLSFVGSRWWVQPSDPECDCGEDEQTTNDVNISATTPKLSSLSLIPLWNSYSFMIRAIIIRWTCRKSVERKMLNVAAFTYRCDVNKETLWMSWHNIILVIHEPYLNNNTNTNNALDMNELVEANLRRLVKRCGYRVLEPGGLRRMKLLGQTEPCCFTRS